MTCSNYIQLLEDYIDNELTAKLVQELKAHIEKCQSCSDELEDLKRLKQLLSQSTSPDPGESYWAESKNIILARTIKFDEFDEFEESDKFDNTENSKTEIIGFDESKADKKSAFRRSLISVAASLTIFIISIMIGSKKDDNFAQKNNINNQFMITKKVYDKLDEQKYRNFQNIDNKHRLKSMMLTSTVGLPGRVLAVIDDDF